MVAAPGQGAAKMAVVDARRLHLLRLGGDALGLAGHRNRAPALAGHRHPENVAGGGPRPRGATRHESHRLRPRLRPDARSLLGGDHPPRGQGGRLGHRIGRAARRRAGGGGMNLDLPLVFAALMGVAVLAYVVLDGYDLGVGAVSYTHLTLPTILRV